MFPSGLFFVFSAVFAVSTLAVAQNAPVPAPVSVMVVGDFHMSNPGHDLHDMQADDVLLPKRQAEIQAITKSLAAFRPTKVMAEWSADLADEQYAKYLAGALPPSRNEVVQLGFRLAQTAGLKRTYGIDVDGDFPYEAVQTFAQAHGQTPRLERANAKIEGFTQGQTTLLRTRGIAATLRFLNDPTRLKDDNQFYREMLFIGADMQQPGDRIVIFYGSGHAFLLRQCVTETPGFKLVEPNDYLPK